MAYAEIEATSAQVLQANEDQDLLALTIEPLNLQQEEVVEGIEPVASIMSVIALTWAT